MKKSNNTISDWLKKYGNPEIEEQVEKEIEMGEKSTLIDTSNKKTQQDKRFNRLYCFLKKRITQGCCC